MSIDYEATGPRYAVDKLLDVRERGHQTIAPLLEDQSFAR
jgi:hypothetical protein